MIRMLSGPSLVSAIDGAWLAVGIRGRGGDAESWGQRPRCAPPPAPARRARPPRRRGSVIFTTPTGSPCTVARKFWSCWLPSGASVDVEAPLGRARARPPRRRGGDGAGSSPAPKKSNPTRPEGVPAPASASKTLLSSDMAPLSASTISARCPRPAWGRWRIGPSSSAGPTMTCHGAFVTGGSPRARVPRAARRVKRRSPVASCIVTVVPRSRCASWIALA